LKDLFYDLSQQTVYYRFMSDLKRIPRKQIQDFVYIDHRNDIAVVGTVPEADGEKIVAIGRYFLDPTTNLAEVAFVGNDINDLPCLTCVALPIVVHDAHPDVIVHALYRTSRPGGYGAVREVCDLFEKYRSGVQGSEVQGLRPI